MMGDRSRVHQRPGGPHCELPTRREIADALYHCPAAADVVDGFGLPAKVCDELAGAVLDLLARRA